MIQPGTETTVKTLDGIDVQVEQSLQRASVFIAFGPKVLLCVYPDIQAISVGLKSSYGVYEHAGDLTTRLVNGESFLTLHSIAIERMWLNGGETVIHNELGSITDVAVHLDLLQKAQWWDIQNQE